MVEAARMHGGAEADSVARAARALGLLERALELHDGLRDSGPNGHGDGADPEYGDRPVATALGGVWLLGRGGEMIAACGDDAAASWGATAHRLVRARTIEFEDLYDAARSPARYLTVAELRSGSLFSLAARLGGLLTAAQDAVADALDRFGRQLGVATEIEADLAGLRRRDEGGRAVARVGTGNYPLALLYALESDPELAAQLGKPIGADAVTAVVERVRAAGGLERAGEECRRRALAAKQALAGMTAADPLLEIADRVIDGWDEPPA
jgi:geranylgeranyl pyrophosphate synthase